jgi:hypothetical protein
MGYQLAEQFTEETHEIAVRKLHQSVGQWRARIISVGLSPDEHLDSELLEQTEDRFGNVKSRCYRGQILISDEALAKIKQVARLAL